MTLSSYERIPPNPFSQEFRDLIEEMREELVELIEMRTPLEEVLERPWPIVELGAPSGIEIQPAVVVSNLPFPANSIRWQYQWGSAVPDVNDDLILDLSPDAIGSSDPTETFALNLTEQFNVPDVTASYGVDIAPTANATAEVLPIPDLQSIVLFTFGTKAGPEPTDPPINLRYFIAENAINFTCVTP